MKFIIILIQFITYHAWAGSQTSTFNVTTTVNANCLISTNTLDFGNYTGSQIDASTILGINCTNGTPYTIALNVGTGSGASFANRILTSGSSTMMYNLYTDTTRSTVWGDSTSSTQIINDTGTGTNQNHTVYGRLPGTQTPTNGTYSDTITVTVSY